MKHRGYWLLLLSCVVAFISASTRADRLHELSTIIYPKSNKAITFSHTKHMATPCKRCHNGINQSSSTKELALPREAICRPCHEDTRKTITERMGPKDKCGSCHTGYQGGDRQPKRLIYESARLRFGHRLHFQKGIACSSCHRFSPATRALPTMTTCRGCHKKRGADSRCVVCHLSSKDGRLLTRFGRKKLLPSGVLTGDTHNRQFRKHHSAIARGNRRYCNNCHQPKDCLRCHKATLRPMSIHGSDYTLRHANDAKLQQTRCRSCHRSQTFCLSCHQRSGVGTETSGSGFRPHTNKRFHSDVFVGMIKKAGHHSYAARRNINSCVSCHREKTCIRCHGTRALKKGGFSPHPPGFRSSHKCRSLSAGNQRVCLKCHTLGDRRLHCK